jgi:TolB-like protein/DNA-binding winged helix-turn-helix (wHTH) protein/Flp pilus assembly protein TadD
LSTSGIIPAARLGPSRGGCLLEGQSNPAASVRFAEFELDLRTGDLRRNETLIKLQPQPAKVLTLLVSRAGQVVTHEEITRQVWGSETFVNFEQGLHFAVRQVRIVLGDKPEQPRFIETLPRRGYRFVAPIKPAAAPPEAPSAKPATPSWADRVPRRHGLLVLTSAAMITFALVFGSYRLVNRKANAATLVGIRSLAVLPLHNLSDDADQAFFSDGMTDELITDFAMIRNLRVISHTSVERYKEAKRPLPDIARELGVEAIVEGTVMRSGDRVRITAQLIDARSDQHLWAESYERDFSDVLGIQGEVARQIAHEVGIHLTADEQSRLTAAERRVDPAAHDAYLKGTFFLDLMKCTSFTDAVAYFRQAVAKDQSFAPAYSGLADTYFYLSDWRCWQATSMDEAETSALKALELDPGNSQAHAVLGKIAFSRDWNWVKAAQEFNTATHLDPNNAHNHSAYGMFLVAMGKTEQGLAEVRKAQVLDPFSETTNLSDTWALYLAHHFDDAISHAKQALSLLPSYGEDYWLGQCYENKAMPEQAIDYYLKAWAGLPDEVPLRRAAYQKHGLPGYWQEDERLRRQRKGKIDAVYEAMYYAHRREKEKAIEQLELAYQQHYDGLQFLKVEPVYDSLRDDPRFKKLLARLGL